MKISEKYRKKRGFCVVKREKEIEREKEAKRERQRKRGAKPTTPPNLHSL
jgi:hypothetical protein